MHADAPLTGRPRPPICPESVGSFRVRLGPMVPTLLLVLLGAVAVGCTGEDATPIDPANPPVTTGLTDVSHSLEPTNEMRQAAEQQCLDDETLGTGYVRAVDPTTDAVLSEISIDCEEVRAAG